MGASSLRTYPWFVLDPLDDCHSPPSGSVVAYVSNALLMPAGQRGTDSRAGSVSSVATNESQTRNAALLGAAKAFGGGGGGGGGVVKSKPKPSNAGDWKAGFDGAPQNGALAAARGTRVPAPDHGGYKRATHLPPPIDRGSSDMDIRAAAARAQVELGRHRLAVPQQLQPQPQQQRPQQ